MRKRILRHKERGMALLIVILALLLVSAIGMGMIYMANTETSVSANYRDTQVAFFSMRAGLEEMRDRMRTSAPYPVTLPTVMPTSTIAGSILYITNPAGPSDTVDPKTYGNTYFDDEFCHETFSTSGVTYQAPGTVCAAAAAPPSGAVTYTASIAPYTNTPSALKYKWVRLTLKQNGTFPNALVDPTQTSAAGLASQVCWDSMNSKEVAASASGYANCTAAVNAGLMWSPVYIVTTLGYTPQGSRRVGQYEVAAYSIQAPDSAMGVDGAGANFSPTSSNNFFINGVDSGTAGWTASGGSAGACTPSGPSVVPAVAAGSALDASNDISAVSGHPNRASLYTGCTAAAGCTTTSGYGYPAIVNGSSTGTNQLSGIWSSPSQLNAMVASLANGADVTLNCGIGTGGCSGTAPYGTPTSTQITFVNGDFNYGGASGAGVLVVTGTLSLGGAPTYDGLILVIGQGILSGGGGGNGQINGSVFIANTNSNTSPYAQLTSLGAPSYSWGGGGTNGIQYNSCWANIGQNLHYNVVASREEMY